METLKIKTDWNEINLQTYILISKINENKDLKNRNLQKAVEIIAALSNKTLTEVLEMDKEMLNLCLEKIHFINDLKVEDRSKELIEIDNVKYMFEPNFDSLSAGIMISIEQLIMSAVNEDAIFLDDLIAILCRRAIPDPANENEFIIEKFDANTIQLRKKLFNEKLFVPFFLQRLTDFFFGSKQLDGISKLYSAAVNRQKEKIKELVN